MRQPVSILCVPVRLVPARSVWERNTKKKKHRSIMTPLQQLQLRLRRQRMVSVVVTQLVLLGTVGFVVSGVVGGSSSSASASAVWPPQRRPPFLQHVTEQQLAHARRVAERRHRAAVQQALSNYPIDNDIDDIDIDNDIIKNNDINIDNHLDEPVTPLSSQRPPPHVHTSSTSSSSSSSSSGLRTYPLQCPGRLPDFHDAIPTAVHVTDPPLLSQRECAHVIRLAEDFFSTNTTTDTTTGTDNTTTNTDNTTTNTGNTTTNTDNTTTNTDNNIWPVQQSGQYSVSGFYIHQVPAVHAWFLQTVRRRLVPLLTQTFAAFCQPQNNDTNNLVLCVDNAYLFKYTPETGRRTDVHTDSGCLSFTIALNSPGGDDTHSGYTGGGTWFEGLQSSIEHDDNDSENDGTNDNNNNDKKDTTTSTCSIGNVLSMTAGQVTIRPGGVKHCGHAVTGGTRYIIGGFCMHRQKPEVVRMLLLPAESSLSDEEEDEEPLTRRALLEAATVLNPYCDAAYNLLANCYESEGYKQKAQEALEYCLNHVHESSGEIAYSLGSIYLEQGLFQKAKDCMAICLKTDNCDVDAMMGMATASAALGESDTEHVFYQRIVDTPGANPTILASAYCNLGVLHEGDDSEIQYYQECLALLPHNYAARYSLACAHASRKEWTDAIQHFRHAIAVLPLDSTTNDKNPKQFISEETTSMTKLLSALQSLYIATAHLLQDEPPPTSREAMLERFQEVMGADNYSRLVNLRSQGDAQTST